MPSSYYTHATGKPANQTRGLASEVRYELDSIAASFDLLPSPTALASGSINYALDTGLTNAYVVSVSSAVTAYSDGFSFFFKPLHNNSGASTLNVNTLGLKAIVRPDGTAVQLNDIVANQILKLTYNSSYNGFQLDTDISYANQAAASASAAAASAAATAGAIVTERSATATLTNKTLAAPVITGGASISGNVAVAGNVTTTGKFNATSSGSDSVGVGAVMQFGSDAVIQTGATAGNLDFWNYNAGWYKRLTLDAIGNLLLGGTTTDQGRIYVRKDSSTAEVIQIQNESSTGKMLSFRTNGNTQVGSVSFTVSTVTYNTTSDYRLKNNIRPADAKRFMEIEFVDFEWPDGRHDCGVIAHQLAKVYPGLVLGDKDATEIRTVEITPAVPAVTEQVLVSEAVLNEEGEEIQAAIYESIEVTPAIAAATEEQERPVYQQVNYTGLVGRIGARVQALQRTVDAQAETIAALIARIEALEARA